MTVQLTGNGGIFTRLGHVFGGMADVLALEGGTATARVLSGASMQARYGTFEVDASYTPVLNFILDGYYAQLQGWQSQQNGICQQLQSLASNYVIQQVNLDTPLASLSLNAALKVLIAQMNTSGSTIQQSTVAIGAQTAVGTPNGNAIIALSKLNSAGVQMDTIFPETLTLTCTTDSQGGATLNQEQLTLSGQNAVANVYSFLWPGGSGVSAALKAIDATTYGSTTQMLTNGSFETFTNTNVPDNWTVGVGTAGTQIFKGSTAYDGSASLQFTGDGSNLTAVYQPFNTTPSTGLGTGGTPSTLKANTVYAVNCWVQVSATPAAGVLAISLTNNSGTVTTDAAGNANTVSKSLPSVSTSWVNVNGFFRTPAVLPSGFRLQVALSTALSSGKALALDTPIPTPSGWSTMGSLSIGDKVFDENGLPCTITNATDVMKNRPCYAVRFCDGTEIIADANHQWAVNEVRLGSRKHRLSKVMTTQEMVDAGKTDKCLRFSIPVSQPLAIAEAELPIDPYVFGVWLGDGCSRASTVTCADQDRQIVDEIRATGTRINRHPASLKSHIGVYSVGGDRQRGVRAGRKRVWDSATGKHKREGAAARSMLHDLRDLDVLRNKHIPQIYLRASANQRWALLQGLMDTDGTVDKIGYCTYTTTTPKLRDGVLELIRSLGLKASYTEKEAKLYGESHGPCWNIRFTAFQGTPVFRLARKLARLRRCPNGNMAKSKVRRIRAFTPIDSVPVRCIEVDSPKHLYLAGEAMIPTHNSVFIDRLALTPATQIYSGGPQAAVFSGNSKLIQGDSWTVAITNTYGVMAQYLERLFSLRAQNLYFPSAASSPTVADSLVT